MVAVKNEVLSLAYKAQLEMRLLISVLLKSKL